MKQYPKKLILLALASLFLLLPLPVFAGTDFCDNIPIEKQITISNVKQRGLIATTLADYTVLEEGVPKYLFQKGGYEAYCLVFNLTVELGKFPIELSLTLLDDHDVYIKGLKNIFAYDDLPSLLTLTNPSPTKTIFLLDSSFKNVETGITLAGAGSTSGRIELHHVDVTGDESKAGSCIYVQSQGAVLDDVVAQGCGEGIEVEANEAVITSSGSPLDAPEKITTVSGNKVGIHVLSGATGTKITRSKIYGNDDGIQDDFAKYTETSDMIRIEGGAPDRLILFDAVGQDIEPLEENMAAPHNYQGRKAYIHVPLLESKNIPGNVTIDFFLNTSEWRHRIPQITDLLHIDKVSCVSTLAQLKERPCTFEVPEVNRENVILAIYNDPEKGTTALSQSFINTTGVVAFVGTYLEQTTPGMGGGSEISGAGGGDVGGGTDLGSGGDTGTITTAGGDTGTGGALSGAKACALAPESPRHIPWPSALLLAIILATPTAGLVTVRISKPRR